MTRPVCSIQANYEDGGSGTDPKITLTQHPRLARVLTPVVGLVPLAF